jgi:hypothetical protein
MARVTRGGQETGHVIPVMSSVMTQAPLRGVTPGAFTGGGPQATNTRERSHLRRIHTYVTHLRAKML